ISVITWIRYIYRGSERALASPPLLLALGGLIAITLSEILIWIFWLALADGKIAFGWGAGAAVAVAAVVLMILMQSEHSVEMGLLKRKSRTAFLLKPNTIFFTFREVSGAVAWLYFVRA